MLLCLAHSYVQYWPELYIYAVYDRIFDEVPAKITVYTPYIHLVLVNPIYVQGTSYRQPLPSKQHEIRIITSRVIHCITNWNMWRVCT
jgi:hypothetical protein